MKRRSWWDKATRTMIHDPPLTDADRERYAARLKDMLESHEPPGTKGTEKAFMQGRDLTHGMAGDPEWLVKLKCEQAAKAGISIAGKVYIGGLADGRGGATPDAWVSGPDDVIAACKRRNLNASGCVNYQGHDVDPGEDAELAPDIVEETVQKYTAVNPDLKHTDKRELREMIKAKHGNKASKGDSAGSY